MKLPLAPASANSWRLSAMADINDCIPGRRALVLRSGVARVEGKTGVIVEVSRVRRPPTGLLRDKVVVDVPGHGEISVAPADLELAADPRST